MPTVYEKSWQFNMNLRITGTNSITLGQTLVWYYKALLKGDIGGGYGNQYINQGLWTTYYSCDGTTAGTANDKIDRWGSQGSATANTGVAASIVTGATITGAIRLTGLTGMATSSVGNCMTISGAASAGNNSATNTPWRIVNYVSATSVDIYNPNAVASDANNGSITWTERGPFTSDTTKIVNNTAGNAHSWFVLVSPTGVGPVYLIVDCNSATKTQWQIVFCKTAPTGGNTTARPTSTDEWGNTATANWGTASQFKYGLQFALSTDGTCFHIFTALGSNVGVFDKALVFQKLADAKSGDGYPYCVFLNVGGSLTASNWAAAASHKGYKADGSAILAGLVTMTPGTATVATVAASSDFAADMTTGKYWDLPAYIFNNTAAAYTLKGRWQDIRWTNAPIGSSSNVSGIVEPYIDQVVSMTAFGMWVPANALPAMIF